MAASFFKTIVIFTALNALSTANAAPALISNHVVSRDNSSSTTNSTSGFSVKQNALDAQKLNLQFANLSASDSCTDGQQTCVNSSFAQCVGSTWELTQCASGTSCFALPLVAKAGTSLSCDTQSDAVLRFQSAGVQGGTTGQGSGNSTTTNGTSTSVLLPSTSGSASSADVTSTSAVLSSAPTTASPSSETGLVSQEVPVTTLVMNKFRMKRQFGTATSFPATFAFGNPTGTSSVPVSTTQSIPPQATQTGLNNTTQTSDALPSSPVLGSTSALSASPSGTGVSTGLTATSALSPTETGVSTGLPTTSPLDPTSSAPVLGSTPLSTPSGTLTSAPLAGSTAVSSGALAGTVTGADGVVTVNVLDTVFITVTAGASGASPSNGSLPTATGTGLGTTLPSSSVSASVSASGGIVASPSAPAAATTIDLNSPAATPTSGTTLTSSIALSGTAITSEEALPSASALPSVASGSALSASGTASSLPSDTLGGATSPSPSSVEPSLASSSTSAVPTSSATSPFNFITGFESQATPTSLAA